LAPVCLPEEEEEEEEEEEKAGRLLDVVVAEAGTGPRRVPSTADKTAMYLGRKGKERAERKR